MSDMIIDAGVSRQVPGDCEQAARVRLLAAYVARRLLTMPPDASKRSRDTRIRIAWDRTQVFIRGLCETTTRGSGTQVTVFDEREWHRWYDATAAASQQIRAALDAGEDLTAFLFPID